MVSDDFKPSYNRFLPGSTPEQATVTSTNTLLREPVKPFSATPIPLGIVSDLAICTSKQAKFLADTRTLTEGP